MDNSEALRDLERLMLDLKPDDVFMHDVKRKMLGHIDKKEWNQLALIKRTDLQDPDNFIKTWTAITADVFARADGEGKLPGIKGVFQLCDFQHKFLLDIPELGFDTNHF